MRCPTCGETKEVWVTRPGKERAKEPCPRCVTGELHDLLRKPGLADVMELLERQAKTCERIAATLTEIQYTVRQLK